VTMRPPPRHAPPGHRAARRARRGHGLPEDEFWRHDGLADLVEDESREDRSSGLRRAGRALGMAGGGVALVGALAVGLFPTQTFLEQRADTRESEERLEVLRTQNEAYEERIARLQTDEEIERLAREQYNLAYPGEEAYAVLPAPLPPLDLPPVWPFGELYDPALSGAEVDAQLDG
jgi:hypothetical protein